MALSTITANSALGTSSPGNLKGTIVVDISVDKTPPAGHAVAVAGMLDNSNPGGYGMVFSFAVPAGKRVDTGNTGSQRDGTGRWDFMKVTVVDDANSRAASTQYWEVWFNQTDVDGSGWSTQVQMSSGGSTYTYTFVKRRTGDTL